jgi:hypothetical protein
MVVPACKDCNGGTSTADLLMALVSRWDGLPTKEGSKHTALAAQIRMQAPEIVQDLLEHSGPLMNRRGRLHLLQHGVPVPPDAAIVTLGPPSVRQLNLFAHKATRAFYYCQYGSPLTPPGAYWTQWSTKEDYPFGVPKYLLDMLPRYGTLVQGRKSTQEDFEFRFDFSDANGVFAFTARFGLSFYVTGFVVADAQMLEEEMSDWTPAGDLMALLDDPGFGRRE